jgi:hypothetical protein
MTTFLASFLLAATLSPVAPDLTGRVVDSAGKPVPSANVYVYTAQPKQGVSPVCPSCYKDCGKHETSDRTGAFRIHAVDPSLKFNILAVADGYEPKFANAVDPASAAVTIQLVPRGAADPDRTVRGMVIDPKGKPVVGALVEPQGYHSPDRGTGYGAIPGVERLSITNDKGEFALRIPDAGAACDVRVRVRNYAPMIVRDITPSHPATISVAEGVTVSGRIRSGDGKPVSGVRIGIVQRDKASRTFLGPDEIGTNDDGLFVLTNLAPNETYVVYGKMESFAPNAIVAKDVKTDAQTVDAGTFTVVPAHRLTGHAVVPEGRNLPAHTRVMLNRIGAWDQQTMELRADGSFEFNGVPSEDVNLIMNVPGLRLLPESDGFDRREIRITADRDRDVKLLFGQ